MSRVKVKICGLTREIYIAYANATRPDWIGFVFAPRSSRAVTPDTAANLRRKLAPGIDAVGVFVNEPVEHVAKLLNGNVIDMAQLHGEEDEAYLTALRQLTKKPLIQAFRIETENDITRATHSTADFILLDHGNGGTGKNFDWSLIRDVNRPFFLAGGINADNVSEAIQLTRPYAVDVSSGVEIDYVKDRKKMEKFIKNWEDRGFSTIWAPGTDHNAVCLIGNTATIDMDAVVHTTEIVEYARRVTEQYKAASRTVHPEDTVIQVGGVQIGGGTFTVISGPCSIENREQMIAIADSVKRSGATILRGGAFKPRTSPYSFQGLGEDGLRLLLDAKKESGLPVVTEMMNQTQVPLFDAVDIVQIGARNMQNFDLLKAVGKMKKPVLLKRGLASTIDELLMSAEYILSEGNSQVILCERGIRTFETAARTTLDLSAVVILKQKTHLPVLVDPSHAAGISSLVPPLAKASLAAGADGLMIETHNAPAEALCDGAQSLNLAQFDTLMHDLKARVGLEGKTIEGGN